MLSKIPKEYLTTLVELLAATNALFAPWRFHNTDRRAIVATAQARRLYRARGLYRPAGGSEATRQAQHRHRKAMQAAGWITTKGAGKGSCVKLTTAGEWYARGLVAASTIDQRDSWALLRLVAALDTSPVLENDLIGNREKFTSQQLVSLELLAEPYLVCGWLDSNSDSQGRVGYFITTEGRKAVAAGQPEPPPLESYPMLDEAAGNHYDAAFRDALAELKGLQPSDKNEIVIPLSCGLWREPTWTAESKALLEIVQAAVGTVEGKANA